MFKEALKQIEKQLNEHRRSRFPTGFVGVDIKGIRLVTLDTNTANHIIAYIDEKGRVSARYWEVLKAYSTQIDVVLRILNEAKSYFELLSNITKMVIDAHQGTEEDYRRAAESFKEYLATRLPSALAGWDVKGKNLDQLDNDLTTHMAAYFREKQEEEIKLVARYSQELVVVVEGFNEGTAYFDRLNNIVKSLLRCKK